jgi:hypothetical protein
MIRPAEPAIAAAMDFPLTLGLAMGFLALGLFAAWRGARPPNPLKGPRMIPWRFLMLLSASLATLMIVHLVNLAGMVTGRR